MHYLLIDSYTDAMPVQNLYRCLALIASEFTNTIADFTNTIADFTNTIADFTNTIADFTNTIADFTNTIAKPDNHNCRHYDSCQTRIVHVMGFKIFEIPVLLSASKG